MTTQNIIDITPSALVKIQNIFDTDENFETELSGLRLGVTGGGCSGLSYKIEMDKVKEKDNILKFDSIKVFIDPKSAIYLKGITLDFKDGLEGKGFVFINPNATNTCGCGESFSV